MGLFSAQREKRGRVAAAGAIDQPAEAVPSPPEGAPSPPAAPARLSLVRGKTLRDELHEIYSRRPVREAFAQQVVELMAGAGGISAVALLGYQQRPEKILVHAHVGLTDDALRVLASETKTGSWDIPLRSIRNRRINVIESAHENPFVPAALSAISPRRLTIAVMPFFQGHLPVGVAVLFSPTHRGFPDTTLQGFSQALRVCAAALVDLPSAGGSGRAEERGEGPPEPTLLRGLAALKAELGRLTQALEEAERQRAAEATERVSAQSFLQAERQRRAALEQEIEVLRGTHERLPGLQREIERLRQGLAEASSAAEAARARIGEVEAALAESRQRNEAATQAVTELTAERERLARELESALAALEERKNAISQLETERDRAAAALSASQGALEKAAAESEERAERVRQATERIAELESKIEALRQGSQSTVEELHARIAEEEQRRRQLDEELARLGAEREELFEQLDAALQEQERLAAQLAEKDILLQSAEQGLTLETEAELAEKDDEVLEIDRSYSGHAAGEPSEPDEDDVVVEDTPSEVVLLEAESWAADAARRLGDFGHRAFAVSPESNLTAELSGRTVACAAVNLAAASSWRVLRHMRNGSGLPHTPMLAYALAPNAPKGFWLGPVDFALLPVGENDLGRALRRLVPKLRRALAMSSDIDVVSDVRTQLSEVGISTAVVLDGRQALDLVPTVRPEAAILHLSPSSTDVFRTIAGLRAAETSRDIPILFLLDHEADAREEGFLTAGVRTLFGRGNLAPGDLVNSLASALRSFQPL